MILFSDVWGNLTYLLFIVLLSSVRDTAWCRSAGERWRVVTVTTQWKLLAHSLTKHIYFTHSMNVSWNIKIEHSKQCNRAFSIGYIIYYYIFILPYLLFILFEVRDTFLKFYIRLNELRLHLIAEIDTNLICLLYKI